MWEGIDFGLIWDSLPDLWNGLIMTVELTLLTTLGGFIISVPLGILRASHHRWASRAIWVYTYFFRGTPTLIQLFLIYYGLAEFGFIRKSGLWPFLREGYWCCVLAFTLNTAAYTIEIIAGAIRNVHRDDIDAAKALGLSKRLIMQRIVLPKALRIMLPAYANEVIFVLQSTSLASVVTVLDLTGVARVIVSHTFSPYEIFITIGLIYLAATYLALWAFRLWEARLFRHLKHPDSHLTQTVPVLR